ncbi:MAG: hypothetical protein ACOC40_00990 [Thermoplasmatota archaeon]
MKQAAFRLNCGFMKPSEENHFSDEKEALGGFGNGGSFGRTGKRANNRLHH